MSTDKKVTPPALVVENVTVEMGGMRVLDDVSFTVEHGSLVGVVGPNGAGKTTLFNAIVGLIPVQRGQVLVHGMPPRKARGLLAYVPQRERVNWRFPLTAWDVAMLGRTHKTGWLRRSNHRDKEVVQQSLERVSMWERRSTMMTELSGGQRQRIFIARALAQEAHTLLLDEAFSGVDVGSQEGLVSILRSLRDEGKAILIATHDLTNLASRFDDVLCINGHVCAWGPPDKAFTPAVLEELYGSHGVIFASDQGNT